MSMGDDIDRSLLDRLQALRGGQGSIQQPSPSPQQIKIDVIERRKTPTREDALAARLKSLRQESAAPEPEPQPQSSPKPAAQRTIALPERTPLMSSAAVPKAETTQDDIEHVFETDDDTLQELLADVTPDEEMGAAGPGSQEPSDEQVKALLEKLADDIPKDEEPPARARDAGSEQDSDDSDGEVMGRKVKDVLQRYQDEAEIDAARNRTDEEKDRFEEPRDEAAVETAAAVADLGLPTVPSNLQHLPASPNARSTQARPDMDDIAARMAALRAPSHNTNGGQDDDEGSLDLPSVPTLRPSGKPTRRLESRTKYTDDDVDSWCTVCLEDATLRCLGCDDDAYCARCWREMHVGPAAAFDDRSHRAVQFTRDKKNKDAPRKVALGA